MKYVEIRSLRPTEILISNPKPGPRAGDPRSGAKTNLAKLAIAIITSILEQCYFPILTAFVRYLMIKQLTKGWPL